MQVKETEEKLKEIDEWRAKYEKLEIQLFDQRKAFVSLEKQMNVLQEIEKEFPE